MSETIDKAREIAARISSHAYMAYAYSEGAYRLIACFLLKEGFTPVQTEYIMDSKHLRWAYDSEGVATSAAFKRYYTREKDHIIMMVQKAMRDFSLEDYAVYIGKQIGRSES